MSTGDLNVGSPVEAAAVQATIEASLGGSLTFTVQPGDVVVTDPDTLARLTPPGLARRGVHRWQGPALGSHQECHLGRRPARRTEGTREEGRSCQVPATYLSRLQELHIQLLCEKER